MTANTYTYRRGKKVQLQKKPNQFVIRQLPDSLPSSMAVSQALQVSTASTQVTCDQSQLEGLMVEGRQIAPTHHAYTRLDTGQDFLITDRVVITFKQDLNVEELGQFAGKYGLEIVEKISERSYLLRLTDSTGMNPVKLVVLLTETENMIANVDHDLNTIAHVAAIQVPTDPFYNRQWHLHQRETPSSQYDPRSSARCEEAWHLLDGFGSSEVVIGVTDDGCQLDHPDFDSPDKFAGWGYFEGINLVTRGSIGASPAKMYVPGADHGTACAGVIAAEIDGQLTVGAAPKCGMVPVQWPSSGSSLFIGDTRLRRALDYLNDKVDVISNSWGSTPTTDWDFVTIQKIDEMVRTGGRRGKGVVFLWAAGNENCPVHHTATIDVPFTPGWQQIGWVGVETSRVFSNDLADRPGIMHVAALASTAQRSHYSNYGTGISICAPSSNSHAYFRLQLPGIGITTTEGNNTVTDSFGGTSSATPLVAGIIGLVLSANPELTALEVISILKQTASKDLNMTGWPKTPPAAFDPDPTVSWDVSPIAPFDAGAFTNDRQLPDGTWSPWFGHGKVDAFAAVQQALELANTHTVRVSASRTPNISVPDRDPAGISDRLIIAERGALQGLKVTVDISHSWIGDLVVRLVSPEGTRVTLHNRAGNNTVNLGKTYDIDSTPQLASLLGTDISGVWTLEVADFARSDTGTLNRWSIDATVFEDNAIRVESTPSLLIPDNDSAGVKDRITVSDTRRIADIAIAVDITHTWSGDLVLELTGPNGISTKLQERVGRDTDNIQTVFSIGNVAELNQYEGESAQGTWTLSVADLEQRDTGKLNAWSLIIR